MFATRELSRSRIFGLALLVASAVCVLLASAASAVTIETVPVGNVGNTGELSGAGAAGGYGPDRICGAVDYKYNIGKYEVTAGQYAEFLNAVAATDTYGLYNTMVSSLYGCQITRNGESGNYTHNVAAEWANRPVNYVSWGDAARFANWMHNGQPIGTQDAFTTEDGSYFLNGAVNKMDLVTVTRKPDATWVIPTEDEWYKAAYHKNDGATGNYFNYPTSTDAAPSNDLVEPTDPGNNATFYDSGYPSGYTIGYPYRRTEIGAHENSEGPYGTFDQGGNVWEWNEAILDTWNYRGHRGGAFVNDDYYLHAAHRDHGCYEYGCIGFRLAEVPEPASVSLLLLGAVAMLRMRGGLRR